MTGSSISANRARPYYSEPFAKGLRILRLFDPEHKSLTLKEISDALKVSPSSAFRFTNTLVQLNYLNKDAKKKTLSLGKKAYLLGLGIVNSFSLLDIVKPFIDDVNERYNISVDSCVLEEQALLQLYFRGAKDSPVYKALIINPAIHCTGLGKAILAYLPDDELAVLLEHMPLVGRTRNSITDRRALLADLRGVRERGYATNDEEYINGLITIATPFFDLRTDRPIGAVSFDFLTSQASLKEAERKYVKPLLKLGRDISAVIK
jgi:DNA-binding IclR family transcriptional regulator